MNNIRWPLTSNVIRRGLSNHTFGMVRNGGAKAHQGWDFYAAPGTPCYAISDGVVEMIYSSKDYGNVLVVKFNYDGKPLFAAYAHLSRTTVKKGDVVVKGQMIALTGATGNARGLAPPDEHLHFEIRLIPRPGQGLGGKMEPS
jgi:peptidoglycan LD-endopeptidase LytH